MSGRYSRQIVLPEVGGKVWGAVVKETGHEFIYRNEVMKFRNIALRGPWTSGGIEFKPGNLTNAVDRSRAKGSGFVLGGFSGFSKHFAGAGEIEFTVRRRFPDGRQHVMCAANVCADGVEFIFE